MCCSCLFEALVAIAHHNEDRYCVSDNVVALQFALRHDVAITLVVLNIPPERNNVDQVVKLVHLNLSV